MAVKQLDFNSLLPSVRRLGSGLPPSPNSKSNAHIPDSAEGLNSPKLECGTQRGVGDSPRRSPLPFYKSDVVSGPIQKPGVVPFLWEQSPGQPKDGFVAGRTQASPTDRKPAPGLSRRSFREKKGEKIANGRSISDSPNCSARAESCFMHYSISGLSEDTESRVSSRRISADIKLTNFSVSQSLPPTTAKSSVKNARSPVESECQEQRSRASINLRNRPQNAARSRKSDDNDDDDDSKFDGLSQLWMKGCGILPRLCLMNPLQSRKNKVTARPGKSSSEIESSWKELSNYKNLSLKGNRVSCDSNSSVKVHGRKNCRSPGFLERNSSRGKEKISRLRRRQISRSESSKFPEPANFSNSWLSLSLPRVPSKEQTLRSLFEKSSIDASVKLQEPPISPMRFADVLARPASED